MIVCQEEVVKEEKDAIKLVTTYVLKAHYPKLKVHSVWGSTMYDLKDLPFSENLNNMPNVFTPFCNKVEKKSKLKKPLLIPPDNKMLFPGKDSIWYKAIAGMTSYLPMLKVLGYTDKQIKSAETIDPCGVMDFKGGEMAALAQVKDYIWDKDLLKEYFNTCNGMIGADYSTKLSPWLVHRCLSPWHVVQEYCYYKKECVTNKSIYWVVFELFWRDFCKFFAMKHGDAIFFPGKTISCNKKWSSYQKNLDTWKEVALVILW